MFKQPKFVSSFLFQTGTLACSKNTFNGSNGEYDVMLLTEELTIFLASEQNKLFRRVLGLTLVTFISPKIYFF